MGIVFTPRDGWVCRCDICPPSPPNLFVDTSEMWCWSRGRGRLAELSLCIVHCNVYCCIIMLHNSTSSSNRSIDMIVSISFSLALSSSCHHNFFIFMAGCILIFKNFISLTFFGASHFHEIDPLYLNRPFSTSELWSFDTVGWATYWTIHQQTNLRLVKPQTDQLTG